MRINNNIMAMNTHRQLGLANIMSSRSMEKLSSGYRINRAGDDAAGLAISEKMRAQIRGLDQASRNAQDGISLIQTAEGALNETHDILQRMRELAVQAASDTNVAVDRSEIQKEINQLTSEINRIGNTTEFNTQKLIDGSKSVTSRTLTSTARTIAVDGSFTANYAEGVTAAGGMSDLNFIESGAITLDAAHSDLADVGVTGSSTLEITKTSSNEFTIEVHIENSAGDTMVLTSTETIEFTEGTDFEYDNHGISFTISSDDFDLFTGIGTGAKMTITDTEVTAGSKSVSMDWAANGSTAQITISTGVTVDVTNNPELENARSIEINATSVAITIDVQDSAGNTILIDDYTYSVGGTTIDYDANGISFSFTSDLAGDTAQITFSLDTTTTNYSSAQTDNSINFQVGANASQYMSLSLSDMRANALGISSSTAGTDGEAGFTATLAVTNGTSSTNAEYALDVSTFDAATAAITSVNSAIESVSSERSKLGAVQNRLEHTIKNLDTTSENLQASESRIRDVDMAKEMMRFTRNNILQQAAQAMLAQANQAPQGVLQLLR